MLLARWQDAATVDRVLFATEMRNLELYGYGVKAHTLSCIETAIELSGGAIQPDDIRAILATGREMLQHPVELLVDHIAETLDDRDHRDDCSHADDDAQRGQETAQTMRPDRAQGGAEAFHEVEQ